MLKSMNLLKLAVSVMTLTSLAAASNAQTTFFVSPCGNDAWTGTTNICVAPDGPVATIQTAIDASSDGDTILLVDGIYNGPGNVNVTFGGRQISVRSLEDNPMNCIIDCEDVSNARGFLFDSGERPDSVLRGITVRNGHGTVFTPGGAILIDGSSPTIERCHFESNRVGGINAHGGAIASKGGGHPRILDCSFRDNRIDGSVTGTAQGGALSIENGDVVRCDFTNNINFTASDSALGGGVHVSGTATFVSCLFVGNETEASRGASYGGGLYNGQSATIIGCTFVDNRARATGLAVAGGSGVFNDGSLSVNSSILFANRGAALESSNGMASVIHSNVEGGWLGTGNIDADPHLDVDYTLLVSSPCLDAGDPSQGFCGDRDLAGSSRVLDGLLSGAPILDMGAFEFSQVKFEARLQSGVITLSVDAPMELTSWLIAGFGTRDGRCVLDYGTFSIDRSFPWGYRRLPAGPGSLNIPVRAMWHGSSIAFQVLVLDQDPALGLPQAISAGAAGQLSPVRVVSVP